jgi:beta-glucuronidase
MENKTWLSGAFYWTLREFRVRPGWDGGNPKPDPPLHQKGVETFDGQRKPAFADLQDEFHRTQQYVQAPALPMQ